LILVLLFAGALSAILGDLKDTIVICTIILLNGFIAFHQDYRAEKGFASLQQLAAPFTRVRRGGKWSEIAARDLVPGDIVYVETGFLVPADGRLHTSQNLRVQEAALTGESQPVEKQIEAIREAEVAVGDRKDMLYMTTHVAYGRGTMIVTATGNQTELGRISQFLRQLGKETTPLQERMQQLGRQLAIAAVTLIVVIFLAGVSQGIPLRLMFFTAVSLAVAAVPEGLPAVVTIALALGAQRMLKRKALIRKLPAVETLGIVTVICSDKTGTLTENRMRVSIVDVLTDRLKIPYDEGIPDLAKTNPSVALLIAGASLCNDAVIQQEKEDSSDKKSFGDPTELAFLIAGSTSNLEKSQLETEMPRIAEVPFTSSRKRMTTLHKRDSDAGDIFKELFSNCRLAPSSKFVAFTKGAVDSKLDVCTK
jgi:Ca2+-transporting ATPase